MIGNYLASVIVYMIIIYCACCLFGYSMKKNGWASTEKPNENKLAVLFCLSAVPIVRIFVVVIIFYMATHTKEEFEKWRSEVKNDDSHED